MTDTKPENNMIIPYLSFDGNCAEAMTFYENALGVKILRTFTVSQMPGSENLPKEVASRIINSQLQLPNGAIIYVGDIPLQMTYESVKGVNLTLSYETEGEASTVFEALASGGHITMPYGPQFWAEHAGMVTDKFGVRWIINAGVRQM